jgi:hypothetical protein
VTFLRGRGKLLTFLYSSVQTSVPGWDAVLLSYTDILYGLYNTANSKGFKVVFDTF